MPVEAETIATIAPGSAPARCPIDHGMLRQQKTAQVVEPTNQPIERDAAGVWHVRGYEQARTILRSTDTRQAGFRAELVGRMPRKANLPILFLDGKPHHEQRKQTARFFTPRAVSENYRHLMEAFADRMIRELQRRKSADLSQLSMKLAVRVAAEVVGLTNSRLPGMDRRLDAFFNNTEIKRSRSPRALLHMARTQARIAAFFYLDVKPAIEARRKQPREDVISHLLAHNYSDAEILTECITYGAAGMATTREFISIAAWHMLEQPELRERYLAGDEDERQQILQELLRLEPVVGHLYRRATADIDLNAGDTSITVPQGSLIDLHIYAINADESIVGEHPLAICPQRDLPERVGPAMMGFGDGHHRCPGAYIALQESDIFLQRLLRLPRLEIRQKPSVSWNPLVAAYEVRQFMLAVE